MTIQKHRTLSQLLTYRSSSYLGVLSATVLCTEFLWQDFGSGEGSEGEQDGMIQFRTGQDRPHQ